MSRLVAAALAFLVSCAPVPPQGMPSRAVPLGLALPPMKAFAAVPAPAPTRPNSAIARDFLDLSFQMESGRAIPAMTRFEGPVRVRVSGAAPASLTRDLDALLGRLRNEAGIDIARTGGPEAEINIVAIPQDRLRRAVPRAACFVVPRVTGWADYLRARRGPRVDWTTLTRRDRAAIFLPADAAPQEIRDCLHEELAQALGPLNDLYRLPDSVFNDDDIHTVLTGFDMLILRATYAPEMQSGLTRAQAAARIGPVLDRLNPAGAHRSSPPEPATSRAWIMAMDTALTATAAPASRRAAASEAIALARAAGWDGPRAGFAHYVHGHLLVGVDPQAALAAFGAADRAYRARPETRIHTVHIAVQRAAFTLAAGDAQATITLVDAAAPIAAAHQNAALLSTLLMFKAEALELTGDSVAAQAVRLDSLGWARYGFGAEKDVATRLAEIAALRPF